MRKFTFSAALAALSAALLLPGVAHAQFPSYVATLDAAQEVPTAQAPAVASNGTGFGSLVLLDLVGGDGIADTMRVNLSVSGLNAAASDSHIHFAAPDQNGPVVVPLFGLSGAGITQTSGGDAVSGFTYSFIGDISVATTGIAGNQTNISNFNLTRDRLIAGNTNHYFNVHTPLPAGRPAGEVRGNFAVAVPEVGTAGLLAASAVPLLGVFVARRRNRACA